MAIIASSLIGVCMAIWGDQLALIVASLVTGNDDGWDLLVPMIAFYLAAYLGSNAICSYVVSKKVTMWLFWISPVAMFLSQCVFFSLTRRTIFLEEGRYFGFNLIGLVGSLIPLAWMGAKRVWTFLVTPSVSESSQ